MDIILEMLANVNLSYDTKLLASNGRVVVIGSRGEVTINPREVPCFDSRVHALGHYSGGGGGHPRRALCRPRKRHLRTVVGKVLATRRGGARAQGDP